MLTKVFSAGTIGLIFGYLSGTHLSYGGALIKLSFIIIFISLFFIKKAKQDILLKSFLVFVLALSTCFIFASIRAKILKDEFKYINQSVNFELKIRDIKAKDSTKIITGEILNKSSSINNIIDTKNEEDKSVQLKNINLKNIVIYSYTQEKLYPDDIIKIEGNITNELIILPKRDNIKNSLKSFDLMKYWNTKGQDLLIMYPKLTKIKEAEQHSIYYYSYIFREKFYLGLEKVMNNENAGILMAMLWGDESHISKELNNKYRDAGISHVLVLSGYNLVLVAAFAGLIFKKLSLRNRVVASIIFVGIFLLLANTSSPVWRASLMSFYVFMTMYFLKPANSRLIIWFTGFMFCLYSPSIATYDVSFHMSFLATLSIIYFYPLLKSLIYIKYGIKDKNNSYKNFIDIILVTISANILILPYIMFQFGTLKLTGVLVSILISGLIPFIMLFGFLAGVFASISVFLGIVFGLAADFLINIMSFTVELTYNMEPLINNGLSLIYLTVVYIILYVIFVFAELYLKIRERAYYDINKGDN